MLFRSNDTATTEIYTLSLHDALPIFDAVTPVSVLVSVGKNNKFKHPSPRVMERYRLKGVEVLRTDLEGALVLESDGERFKRKHWRH